MRCRPGKNRDNRVYLAGRGGLRPGPEIGVRDFWRCRAELEHGRGRQFGPVFGAHGFCAFPFLFGSAVTARAVAAAIARARGVRKTASFEPVAMGLLNSYEWQCHA